ncbi:hypothetical protein IV38_GL001753 [Lactobacillus selangorensis]|uniref:Uncharacterized protein n=1 Tax=Lactobacillus selangorensis TaxID=81857 RepID=A0A0R2FYL6_9LACO|nr:hypothetical protein [Lactobacillus selangorensis]KRN27914.1 hypothetical protein IV38_GL001753 [Lactobacillus selangorensis]KRN30615.1 hypothetical protein IV40_GL001802 [Lactobacillus selangorensis]
MKIRTAIRHYSWVQLCADLFLGYILLKILLATHTVILLGVPFKQQDALVILVLAGVIDVALSALRINFAHHEHATAAHPTQNQKGFEE